jgi:hypothetical protein
VDVLTVGVTWSDYSTARIEVVGEAEIVVIEIVFAVRVTGVPEPTASERSAFARVQLVHTDGVRAVRLLVAVKCGAGGVGVPDLHGHNGSEEKELHFDENGGMGES